jgi:hypothetical protein
MINIFSKIFTIYAIIQIYKNIKNERYVKFLAAKWREMNYKLDDIKFEWIPYYD